MNPEIEKLIDLAIADGQITEKERNVILKKAAELGVDADEVEMTLDGKLHQLEASKPKQKEKVGNIKTCPACGASVKSFQFKCEDCGHEYRETKATKSIIAFYDELKTKSLNEQAVTISSYPIPSNKEDVLEFLALSIGNCKKLDNSEKAAYLESAWSGKYSQELSLRESVISAWQGKTIQAINQGKALFNNDTVLLNEIVRYERQYIEISKDPILVTQEKTKKGLIKILIGIVCLIALIIFWGASQSSDTANGRNAETEKLENIEIQINKDISNKEYDQALLLTNQLHWQHSSTWDHEDQKYISTWDKRREDLKITIEKMKIQNK